MTLTLPLSLLFLVATPATPAPPAAPAATASALLAALEDRYMATRTVRFEFTQRYVNRATGRLIQESGTLVCAKPGRMRWEYRQPEKLFVLKEGVSWFYVPEDKVVYHARAAGDDARRLPALFLTGEGSLTRDYDASLAAGGSEPTLKLVPRVAGEDYDYLLVALDPRTIALRSLSVVDLLGNLTVFEFRGETRDEKVAEKAFDFTPPGDAEVVEAH